MFLGICLSFSSVSCATVMYSGPRRASNEVVRLSASDGPNRTYCRTKITQIDGSQVSDGRYEILPGRHSVKVESKAKEEAQMMYIPVPFGVGLIGAAIIGAAAGAAGAAAGGAKPSVTYDPLTICFVAKPGHEYAVRTFVENQPWEIEVIDDEADTNVKEPCI